MMRTCTVLTPIKRGQMGRGDRAGVARVAAGKRCGGRGFTFAEMIVVLVILSLMVGLAQSNISGLFRRGGFKAQAEELVATMQMAARAAAETGRRYEVVIDLAEQGYMLREIRGSVLSRDMEGEIIDEGYFNENCWMSYVEFDDYDFVNDARAWFWVGPAGWQYGGKIVFLDQSDQAWSIVVNRISRSVRLVQGDAELLRPKTEDEMSF